MQTDEPEFELVSNTLDTPSLMTPNIMPHPQAQKPIFPSANTDVSSDSRHSHETDSSSTTTNSTASSADVKMHKIEDDLKQSVSEQRRPTPSPFQNMSSGNGFSLSKSTPMIVNEDGTTVEIPSTADVVKELEALTNTNPFTFTVKTLMNEASERETNAVNGDNVRYDSPPTVNTGVLVSPKKKFLIRSQSHTEPSSPSSSNNHNGSLSHKFTVDDTAVLDDSLSHNLARLSDLSAVAHVNDSSVNSNPQFKPVLDTVIESRLRLPLRTDPNELAQALSKPSPVVINNNNSKRAFPQALPGPNMLPLAKAGTMIIPQASLNEVSSSDVRTNVKRLRTATMPLSTATPDFRASYAPPSTPTTTSTTNGSGAGGGSDDQRKKQIRDSNREAARRCRERRRQYIEQLEGNLEQYKSQMKQLGDKLARVERENTQLRAFLSEAKILHSTTRLGMNDAHVQYADVIVDSNHQADGAALQRIYEHRNNL